MRAGVLDRRITFQSKTAARDAFGEEIPAWTNLVTVWAKERPMRGEERFTARQIVGKAVATWEIRYRTDFTPSVNEHRITYDGRTWDIRDVRTIKRHEGWEIDVTARSEA